MKKYFLVVVTWLALLGLTTALSNEPKSTNNGEYSVLYLTLSTQDYVSTLKAVDSYKEMKSEDLNLVQDVLTNKDYRKSIILTGMTDLKEKMSNDGYTLSQIDRIEDFNRYLPLYYCLEKEWLVSISKLCIDHQDVIFERTESPLPRDSVDTTIWYTIKLAS